MVLVVGAGAVVVVWAGASVMSWWSEWRRTLIGTKIAWAWWVLSQTGFLSLLSFLPILNSMFLCQESSFSRSRSAAVKGTSIGRAGGAMSIRPRGAMTRGAMRTPPSSLLGSLEFDLEVSTLLKLSLALSLGSWSSINSWNRAIGAQVNGGSTSIFWGRGGSWIVSLLGENYYVYFKYLTLASFFIMCF